MKKIFLAIITFFVLFCVYWATGRTLMLKTLTGEFQSLETQGYDVDHKGLSAGGFPFQFRSSLMEPGLVSPRSISKPWSIKADNLVMQASAFNPLFWTFNHRGEARIDLRGPKGERWLFDVRPFSVNIDVKTKLSGDIKLIRANIRRPQIQAVIGTLPPIVGMDQGQIDIKHHGGDSRYDISMTNVFLEKDTLAKWQTAFGPKIDSFDAIILAQGQISLSDKAEHLIGDRWSLTWNGNVFTGDFNLTRTPSGFDGILRAEVENLPQIIEQFSQAGIFTPQQANAVKIGAKFLQTNERGTQEITLNIRDGYLVLFGQRLYKF